MTEMIEPVSVATIDHEDHEEETCAFCTAPTKPTDEKNTLQDDFDEDKHEIPGLNDDGMALKNSAGQLGKNLAKKGAAQITAEVKLAGLAKILPVTSAAHHVIPGNAALKRSEIMQYLHTDGMATGNIGYNVNNDENGIWLVGNYALRGKKGLPAWGPEGAHFTVGKPGVPGTKKDPYEYAKAAIEATGYQFHDGHDKYSIFVKKTLDLIAKKMELTQDVWCIEAANKPNKPEEQQLFMLVNRLNTVSRRMKTLLQNPGKNWKKNVFTSRFSEKYIEDEIYK